MPTLKEYEPHPCVVCNRTKPYPSRGNLRKHVTMEGTKGPRCTSLTIVIPPAVWTKEFIPYYTNDGPKPDLWGAHVKALHKAINRAWGHQSYSMG